MSAIASENGAIDGTYMKTATVFSRKPRFQAKPSTNATQLRLAWTKTKRTAMPVWPLDAASSKGKMKKKQTKKKSACESALALFRREGMHRTACYTLQPNDPIHVAIASTQGTREYMEDRHVVTDTLFPNCSMVAIYDGHNGAWAAEYATTRMGQLLAMSPLQTYAASPLNALEEIYSILRSTFGQLDQEILTWTKQNNHRDGSTALMLLVIKDIVFVANVGDSRAVRYHNDETIRVSVDHKPNQPAEKARIVTAGGKVVFSGCWRVAHSSATLRLAVSRSLGDHPLKTPPSLITVVPHVCHFERTKGDVVVLASDGLWDRVSDEEGMEYAYDTCQLSKSKQVASAATSLVELALARRTADNVTVAVVAL